MGLTLYNFKYSNYVLNGRAQIESLDECTILSEQGGGAYKMCPVKIDKNYVF